MGGGGDGGGGFRVLSAVCDTAGAGADALVPVLARCAGAGAGAGGCIRCAVLHYTVESGKLLYIYACTRRCVV